MSLMQLLAVGRSIGMVKDRPTPYKMTQQNLLPKFGGAIALERPFLGGREVSEKRSYGSGGKPGSRPLEVRERVGRGWGWMKRSSRLRARGAAGRELGAAACVLSTGRA